MPRKKPPQLEQRRKAKPYSMPSRKSWNTKQIAEMYDVPRPSLLRWVNLGLVIVSKRTPAGAPVWFEYDLQSLQSFLARHKRYAQERRKGVVIAA